MAGDAAATAAAAAAATAAAAAAEPSHDGMLTSLASKYRVPVELLRDLQQQLQQQQQQQHQVSPPSASSSGSSGEVAAGDSSAAAAAAAARGVGPVVAAAYTRLYSRLIAWVLGLWNQPMQEELQDAAFAVLLTIYQRMLLTSPADARDLLRLYGPQHATRHGQLLQQLQQLQPQHPQQLQQLPYFNSEEKHPLYLSERSFVMLRGWLSETKSLALEALLQASVRLLQAPQGAPHLRGLQYPNQQQQQQQQQQHRYVYWGLPRHLYRDDILVTLPTGEKIKACPAAAAAAAAARVRVVGQESLRESELVEGRCLLPLPEASTEAFLLLRKQLKSQAEARAALSPAQLPSVCCFSFLNCEAEASSVSLGRQTARFAALGGVGQILLWDLAQGPRAKAAEMPKKSSSSSSSSNEATSAGAEEGAAAGEAMEEDDGSKGSSSSSSSSSSSGDSCFRFIGHEGRVLALTFAESEDRCLLSGGSDGVIRLWPTPYSYELQQQQQQQEAAADSGEEEEGEQAPRSSKLQQQQQQVVLPLCQYRGAIAPIWSLAASPLGHYFASGGGDSVARLWCSSRSFPLRLLQHAGARVDIPQVHIHPNSSLLLTGASDGAVRLFDLRAADAVRTWKPPFRPTAAASAEGGSGRGSAAAEAAAAGRGGDTPYQVALDHRLISAGGRAAISSSSSSSRCDLVREVTALTTSPNGRLVAAADESGYVYVWDIPSGGLLARSFAGLPAVHAAAAAAFAAEGRSSAAATAAAAATHAKALSFCYNSSLLAGATGDGRVLLWNTAAAARGGASPQCEEAAEVGGLGGPLGGPPDSRPGAAELQLLRCFYARSLAFRVCSFTPENLLLVGGLSTLDLPDA
ncbi:hypothetical protein Efla_006426 [Eimeria flavescens]